MKKIIFLGVVFFFVSCTTADIVSKTSMYTKDEIINKSIERVRTDYGLEIEREDVGIMKTGYGVWKVILYGAKNPIFIMIDENGIIQSEEMRDYIY